MPHDRAVAECKQIAAYITSVGYGKEKGAYVKRWGSGWAVFVHDRTPEEQEPKD